MTSQVRVCKNLLHEHFPSVNFSIKLIRARNYCDSSDKLEVRYDADVSTDKVIEVLRKWTGGMKIDRIGKMQISSSNRSCMYDPTAGRYEDMDLCEFVEVGYVYD